MAGEMSARYGFPFLEAGQAQKELVHNEALALVDMAMQAAVEAADVDVPPAAPVPGQCWIVGSAPTGAWSGHAGAIAGWSGNGWRFVPPREGMRAWVADRQYWGIYTDEVWVIGAVDAAVIRVGGTKVVGERLAGVSAPDGGVTTDGEARAAIVAILDRLREHGLIES